ncbi:hypothetical protein FBF86_10385 [Serratia marcescens]|nr:hypothetical protein FBF86_10385 [Serratia marcescens]QDI30981.1 hypothetical protein FG169_10385 [Serratia marcescens]QDI45470.1 hypothetical protein FG172_10370 [Serratia marcescens]QDI59895.1 hypothetical protein FG175_10370 [Serratia marcescens]
MFAESAKAVRWLY